MNKEKLFSALSHRNLIELESTPLSRAVCTLNYGQLNQPITGHIVPEKYNIQLSPEGEVNSGGYIPRREASRYISTALHRP